MITLKLPIQNPIDLTELLKKFNSCVRFCYQRIKKQSLTETQLYNLLKTTAQYDSLDSWFKTCAIKEALSWFEKSDKIVFGGKKNLKLRSQNKISKEEWKALRLHPIHIIGEANQKGNRKFLLRVVEDNSVIFKQNKTNHIKIQLPKLRSNIKRQLILLQTLAEEKKTAYSVRLNNSFIWIEFDEKILKTQQPYISVKDRYFSIDINPNYVGYSVVDYKDNVQRVVHTRIVENKQLNKLIPKLASNDKKKLKQTHKKTYETFQISKFLVSQAKHFKCQYFVAEDLNMKSKNHGKGRNYNRLVNNNWNRTQLLQNVRKRCNIAGLNFVEVNPAYSSYIGNLCYREYADPVASSLELARRFHTKQFFPDLPSKWILSKLWKQEIDNWVYKDWKELCSIIKTRKLNYRVSLESKVFKVFSLKNKRSKVNLYSF